MRHWLEQQNDFARESGIESTTAAYRDFKVYLDEDHTALPNAMLGNAVPQGVRDLTALPAGTFYDWNNSQIAIPNDGAPGNTTERTFHMILIIGIMGETYGTQKSRRPRTVSVPKVVEIEERPILFSGRHFDIRTARNQLRSWFLIGRIENEISFRAFPYGPCLA